MVFKNGLRLIMARVQYILWIGLKKSQQTCAMLEDWCQKKLSKEVVIYGIRRYLRGAWLSLHVDKLPTHIISVILQVHQTKLYSLSQKLFCQIFNFLFLRKIIIIIRCLVSSVLRQGFQWKGRYGNRIFDGMIPSEKTHGTDGL